MQFEAPALCHAIKSSFASLKDDRQMRREECSKIAALNSSPLRGAPLWQKEEHSVYIADIQ